TCSLGGRVKCCCRMTKWLCPKMAARIGSIFAATPRPSVAIKQFLRTGIYLGGAISNVLWIAGREQLKISWARDLTLWLFLTSSAARNIACLVSVRSHGAATPANRNDVLPNRFHWY